MTQSDPPPGMHNGPRKHLRAGGFTLIEVITVIIILGILAAVATSRANLGNVSSNARALEIRSQIRLVQLRAMKSYTMYGISCDGANYWGFNGTDPGVAAARIPLPGESSTLVPWAGKGITALTAFSYCFDEFGIPYTCAAGAAPVKLAAAGNIALTAGGVTTTLTLTPETGYIPYW